MSPPTAQAAETLPAPADKDVTPMQNSLSSTLQLNHYGIGQTGCPHRTHQPQQHALSLYHERTYPGMCVPVVILPYSPKSTHCHQTQHME